MIIILLIVLGILTIFVSFFYIKNFITNKGVNISEFKSTFKRWTTFGFVVLFYFITFGLIGGMSSNIQKVEKTIDNQLLNHHVQHGDFSMAYSLQEYNEELFDIVLQEEGASNSPSLDWSNTTEENFILNLNTYLGEENFWETSQYGEELFASINNLISIQIFRDFFVGFNNPEEGIVNNKEYYKIGDYTNSDFSMVWNIEMFYTLTPTISHDPNEKNYLVGYNDYDDNFWRESKNGEYVINTLNVYDSKYSNDELNDIFSSNDSDVYGDGSENNPYKIFINYEYAKANDLKVGSIEKINSKNYEVSAIGWLPNVAYPIFSFSNFITDLSKQQLIVTNKNVIKEISNKEHSFYLYYGYSDIYDEVRKYQQMIEDDFKDELNYRESKISDGFVNEFSKNLSFLSHGNIGSPFSSVPSFRATAILEDTSNNLIINKILMWVFLAIIAIIMIIIVQKRVQDNSKRLGTLKALGLNDLQSSASFITFPLLVILFGGAISLLISFPIQMFLTGSYTKFYSLPINFLRFDFLSFAMIFIIPALILIPLIFGASYLILKKPTVDLLTNKEKDKVGVLTRTFGKFIPKKTKFNTSYKVNGLFKAFGKSLLLFFSIFIAMFLASLSFSSFTMFANVTKNIDTSNTYDGISLVLNNDGTQYDLNSYEGEFIELFSFREEGMTEGEQFGLSYDEFAQSIYDDVISLSGEEFETTYIPKESMMDLMIYYGKFKFSDIDTNLNFVLDSGETDYSLDDLSLFINVYFSYVVDKMVKNEVEFSNNILENLSLFNEYLFDVYFNSFVYNSSVQIPVANIFLTGEEKNTQLYSYDSVENILKVFDINDSGLNKLDENTNGDYIPIVVTSAKKQLFYDNLDTNENGYYEFTINSSAINGYEGTNDVFTVEIKVVGTYDSLVNLGTFTLNSQIEKYLTTKYTEIDSFTPYYSSLYNIDEKSTDTNYISFSIDSYLDLLGDFKLVQTPQFSKTSWTNQMDIIYQVVQRSFNTIAVFALLVSSIVVIIAIKEIIDRSKKEISMLKAFGYKNETSTSLVLTPYLVVIGLAVLISIPFALIMLNALGALISSLTGTSFIFKLTFSQWMIIIGFMTLLVVILISFAYYGFSRVDALDAIKEND